MMGNTPAQKVNMLAVLIGEAASGKKVVLNTKFMREVIQSAFLSHDLEHEGPPVDTIILSVEYSGTIDGNPFEFKKNYSFAGVEVDHALEYLLIANNRLQVDYDRLRVAGIALKEDFFTLENSFMGLSGDASLKKPAIRLQDFIYLSHAGVPVSVAIRLQDFIHLSHAGVPVSVDVTLKYPDLVLQQEGLKKKGFACMASFSFSTKEGQTTVEKLYGVGTYDDTKGDQEEIKAVASKRLERDCERLRRAGMEVDQLTF